MIAAQKGPFRYIDAFERVLDAFGNRIAFRLDQNFLRLVLALAWLVSSVLKGRSSSCSEDFHISFFHALIHTRAKVSFSATPFSS